MAKGKRSKIKQHHKREFNERMRPVVAARVAELHNSLANPDQKMAEDKPVSTGEWVVKQHSVPVHTYKEPEVQVEDEGMGAAVPVELAGSTTSKIKGKTTTKVVGRIQKSASKSAAGKKIKIKLTASKK